MKNRKIRNQILGTCYALSYNNMFAKIVLFILFLVKFVNSNTSEDDFIFNGFKDSNMKLDGVSSITSEGLLQLTNTTEVVKGHAFYPIPLNFKSHSGKIRSFSTTFVFTILSQRFISGHGIAFLISPTTNLSTALPSQYLGMFNLNDIGNSTNHIFAVELDTIQNLEFDDIDDNHVGIDINSLTSKSSHTAGYYDDNTGLFKNMTLMSGQPMQVWMDYDGKHTQLNVTLSPLQMSKPNRPLLSSTIDLSSLMLDSMYVGFSSSTGSVQVSHWILGWSFKMSGTAELLDFSKLPSLPSIKTKDNVNALTIWLPIVSASLVLLIALIVVLIMKRRIKYAELLDDWELQYASYRLSYKDLFLATKGFNEVLLLGVGGVGRVYRGILPSSNIEVAIKTVLSREPRKGMKEFVAEIVKICQIHHRNITKLLGYCRREGELILAYEYVPNGSLDRFLHDQFSPTLNWAQRFRIIKGVASGLLHLHEDWEPQAVYSRDIKSSNVLIDSEFNGKLGDFCLSRLYNQGPTHLVGTMGYLAPELARTGKATTLTDVFSFGVLLLETVCGRRPVEPNTNEGLFVLMDWVLKSWQKGLLTRTIDLRLRKDYRVEEVELVLKLGLLCSNPVPTQRPSMLQVVQILDGNAQLPDLSSSCMNFGTI